MYLYIRGYIFIISLPCTCITAILDSLQELKQIPGVVTGKQGGNSIYIPTVYSKSQSEWVENFYKQNGYLGKIIYYIITFKNSLCDEESTVCFESMLIL